MEPSPARVALKWGLLTALVMILLTSIRYALGYYFSFSFPLLTLIVLIAGLTLAMRELRTQNGGYMSYTEGLSLGALMFAIIGLLDTSYTMMYQAFVDPDVVAKTLGQTRDFMESFNVPDDQLEKYDEQMEALADETKKGVNGIKFITGIFGWIFWGFLLSLIVSGFVSRKKTNPFD
jgi:amino acid transporter